MAAVPFVPTSACLCSSTLGDSRVAPNSFCPEQRENELECNFKIREERDEGKKTHKQYLQLCLSNLLKKKLNGVEEALASCHCLKENANHKKI